MKFFVPILGLENSYQAGNLSPIQELAFKGLEPLSNINYDRIAFPVADGLGDLLNLISNICHSRLGICLKGFFEFNEISNCRILNKQTNLSSLGLGLITCLCYEYSCKQSGKNIKNAYDTICITGVLAANPSAEQKKRGNFLSEQTGKIPEKFIAFLEYIKKNNLPDDRCIFIYCGREEETTLKQLTGNYNFSHVVVKKISNFDHLMGLLNISIGIPNRDDSTRKSRKTRSLLTITTIAALLTVICLVLPGFVDKHVSPGNLVKVVKNGNLEEIGKFINSCSDNDSFEAAAGEAFIWALNNHRTGIMKLLIDAGAIIDANLYTDNLKFLNLIESASQREILSALPVQDLDERAVYWGTYVQNKPVWSKKTVSRPALKGKALQYSLRGGTPYSNIHGYVKLPASLPDGSELIFKLSFQFQPETTFNNINTISIIQALEFSLSVCKQTRRGELALQWENVGDIAPQWRYWNSDGKWESTGIMNELTAMQWHSLVLYGKFDGGKIAYQGFKIDDSFYKFDIIGNTMSTKEKEEYVSLAIQLDGNYQTDPYLIYVDNVELDIREPE